MRLLLAEDEKQLAEALCEILHINKYSVDVVHNGQDALDYIDMIHYDAIILDIMMPKVDGITVLKEMRKKKNQTPVLLLTAKSQIADKVAGLDAGADDYLAKPFAVKELLARIRVMTRRTANNFDGNLTFGDISLSTTNYTLSCKENEIILANKEYQVLEKLMINTNKYITSDEFMEQIWGYNSESEINVVWVHISALRRKLEKIKSSVKIKSLRNLGYILEKSDDQ